MLWSTPNALSSRPPTLAFGSWSAWLNLARLGRLSGSPSWLWLLVCLARCFWSPHGSPVRTGFQLRCGSGLECGGGSDLSQAHRLSAAVKGPTGPFSGLSSFFVVRCARWDGPPMMHSNPQED
ncbi:unnamed protein product [Dicrocoelium dendriticum]|nr:unnamed protein product [Dicrocoelium dendriticum]